MTARGTGFTCLAAQVKHNVSVQTKGTAGGVWNIWRVILHSWFTRLHYWCPVTLCIMEWPSVQLVAVW
jgi:hypothetical protein